MDKAFQLKQALGSNKFKFKAIHVYRHVNLNLSDYRNRLQAIKRVKVISYIQMESVEDIVENLMRGYLF